MLEEVGFIICKQCKYPPWNVFGNESFILVHQPLDANSWKNSCNDAIIQCPKTFKLFNQQQNKWEDGCALQVIVLPPTWSLPPMYGLIYNITSNVPQNLKQYEIIILKNYCALAWILSQWLQVHWMGGGSECIVSTCTFCNVQCIVSKWKKNLHHPNWGWSKVQRLISHARWIDFSPI